MKAPSHLTPHARFVVAPRGDPAASRLTVYALAGLIYGVDAFGRLHPHLPDGHPSGESAPTLTRSASRRGQARLHQQARPPGQNSNLGSCAGTACVRRGHPVSTNKPHLLDKTLISARVQAQRAFAADTPVSTRWVPSGE